MDRFTALALLTLMLLQIITLIPVQAQNINPGGTSFESEKEKYKPEVWKQVPAGDKIDFLETGNFDEDLKDEIIYGVDTGDSVKVFIIDDDGTLLMYLGNLESYKLVKSSRGMSFRQIITRILTEDVDGDGVEEIFLIRFDEIQAISLISNGINWKSRVIDSIISFIKDDGIVFYDVNKDGVKDIIKLAIIEPVHSINSYIFDGRTGKLLSNFTVTNKSAEVSTLGSIEYLGRKKVGDYGVIHVSDIDNDGSIEILIGFIGKSEIRWYYVLYCYSLSGLLLWRKEIDVLRLHIPVMLVSLNDYNNDGVEEILLTGSNGVWLLDNKGNIIWGPIKRGFVAPPDWSNVVTVNGDIIIFSSDEVLFINPFDGTILRTITTGEKGEIVFSATVLVKQTKHERIIFSTDKGFYILDDQGSLINSIVFNTYSWFKIVGEEKAIIYTLSNTSIYIVDLHQGNIFKLFDAMLPGSVRPVNLDNDPEPEYLVLSSILQAYDTNGLLNWVYGLYGTITQYLSKTADLDNDGDVDVIFFKGSFQESIVLFKNGKAVYATEDCIFYDINDDGFYEVITASDRGLEVYDMAGNLMWRAIGADFRLISAGELFGEKVIAVSVGIFAQHMGMPPQVRFYSNKGELLRTMGPYWDPPYVQILRSATTKRGYLLIIAPLARYKYQLEVYDELGALLFSVVLEDGERGEDVWRWCYDEGGKAELLDVNKDGKEELVLPPFVFTLNGELLSNNYPRTEIKKEYYHLFDIDGDGQDEYIDLSYSKPSILIYSSGGISILPFQEFKELVGFYMLKSKHPGEVTLFLLALTSRGYWLVPITFYYVKVLSSYGKASGSGLYRDGDEALIKVSEIIDHGNGTRRVFISWTGDINATTAELVLKVNSRITLIANWKTQYYLKVISEFGNVSGEGWYDKGSIATFSVSPTIVDSQHVFAGWSGDSKDVTPTATIVMDGPKVVVATWQTQQTSPHLTEESKSIEREKLPLEPDKYTLSTLIIAGAIIMGIIFTILWRWKLSRKLRKTNADISIIKVSFLPVLNM